jgi:uncharacterized membrane protein YbhN (UPF0104 family)
LKSPGAQPRRARVAALWRRWPGTVLRIAFAILPLYFLFKRISLREALGRSHDVSWLAITSAIAAYFAGQAIAAVRWRTLLVTYGGRDVPSFWALFRLMLVGSWFSALPSGLAGDAVRGYSVRRCLPDLTSSYTAIVVERIAGLLGLAVIAGLAVASGRTALPPETTQAILTTALVSIAAGGVALFVPHLLATRPALRDAAARVPLLGGLLLRVPYARSVRGPLLATLLSLGTQGFGIVGIGVVLHEVAPQVPWTDIVGLVPAILLLTIVIVTPAGVGQREWVFVWVLSPAGVAAPAAVAAAWVSLAIGAGSSVSGGLLYGWERWRAARAAANE